MTSGLVYGLYDAFYCLSTYLRSIHTAIFQVKDFFQEDLAHANRCGVNKGISMYM